MKKMSKKSQKLVLNKETVRNLQHVRGGEDPDPAASGTCASLSIIIAGSCANTSAHASVGGACAGNTNGCV